MFKKMMLIVLMIAGVGFSEEQQIKSRYVYNTSFFSNILDTKETNKGNYIFNYNEGEIVLFYNNYISVYNVTKVQHNVSFLQYNNCTSFATNYKFFKKFYVCGDDLFDVAEAGFIHYYNSK